MKKLNKRIITAVLALAMCAGLSVTSFAATGYDANSKPVDDVAIVEVVDKAIDKAVNDAIKAGGKAEDATAKVSVKNASEITPEAIKKVAEQAAKKGVAAVIQADTTDKNGAVIGRISIDPTKLTNLDSSVKLTMKTENKPVNDLFTKFFDNEIALVSFDQQKTFGTEVRIAVKVDLAKLNKDTLVFYSYDAATNTYSPISNADYTIDANGYIHFSTEKAGSIIISDKPLTLKK